MNPDPDRLGSNRPAVVEITQQGPVFVADARIRDNGWLAIMQWDGTRFRLPPHRVEAVKRLETEFYDPADEPDVTARPKRLASQRWREQAKGSLTNGDGTGAKVDA